jgi:hypothetical protein
LKQAKVLKNWRVNMNMYVLNLSKDSDKEELSNLGGDRCNNLVGMLEQKPMWQFSEDKVWHLSAPYNVYYEDGTKDSGDGVYDCYVMRLERSDKPEINIILHEAEIINLQSLNGDVDCYIDFFGQLFEPVFEKAKEKGIGAKRAILLCKEWADAGANLFILDDGELSPQERLIADGVANYLYADNESEEAVLSELVEMLPSLIKGMRNYYIVHTL